VLQYRAELAAAVTLTSGGSLRIQGLRIDVPHPEVTRVEIAALLVAALGLRDVERVELDSARVFGDPAEPTGSSPIRQEFVELSHVVSDGRSGTCLAGPRHRYEDGTDLAGLPLGRLADLPAVVVRTIGSGSRAVEAADLESLTVAGHAVLLHTGGDRHWGTAAYAEDNPYLSTDAARLLVERGAALVGIDSVSIDSVSIDSVGIDSVSIDSVSIDSVGMDSVRIDDTSTAAGERRARSILLAAGIPIVEHLTGLAELPPVGARFTAAPPRIAGLGTFLVRAFASMPWYEPHDHTRSAGWQPTTVQG
jgi:arylformamidase